MDSLYILIPIAIVFVAIAVKVFFWAVDNHQFDDLDTEAQRILFDKEQARDQRSGEAQTSDEDKNTPQ